MRFCNATNCEQPVFSTCKISKKGYCKSHQHLKENFDSRSITQRGVDKRKKEQQNTRLRNNVRSLHTEDIMEGMSRNSLIQDLDKYCSLYVRIRDADKDGMVRCFTCYTTKHYTLMQAGHFISRSHIGLRFDVKNNQRTQCQHCNCHLHGNLDVFATNLEQEQEGLVEMLQEQSRNVEKIGTDELSQLLIDIRGKYNSIKTKLINSPKN